MVRFGSFNSKWWNRLILACMGKEKELLIFSFLANLLNLSAYLFFRHPITVIRIKQSSLIPPVETANGLANGFSS